MNKHTEALKLLVVKEYLEGTIGYVTLGHKHGLDPSMIKRWVARYRLHGIKGISKKFTRYSAEFKLSVLMHLWDNDLSYRQASAYFNIRSPGVLPQWVRLYREGGFDALQPRKKERKPLMSDKAIKSTVNQAAIAQSNEALLKELNHLRLENAYLKKLHALVQEKQKLAQKRRRK